MADQPASMWRHWRDKYGYEKGLREYYPQLVTEPRFALALAQIENGRAVIDGLMSARSEAEDDAGE